MPSMPLSHDTWNGKAPITNSRIKLEIEHNHSQYFRLTPAHIQRKIEELKEDTCLEQECTLDEKILENMEGHTQDPGNTRTRDIKYFKNIALKWQIKSLLSKAILDTQEERNGLILMMDEIIDQNNKLHA